MIIVLGILMFGFLVFIHELGHFITAKKFGIKVNEFAIGMGPAIFKTQKGETKYSLRLLPIGGFVGLEGEDGDSEDPRAFSKKSPLKRIIVLSAGVIANILMGFLLYIILYLNVPAISVPVVESVLPETPAYEAGIQAGDRIYKINGSKVNLQSDVTFALYNNADNPVEVIIDRKGEKKNFLVTPEYNEESGRYILGYMVKNEEMTIPLAIKTAYYDTLFSVKVVYFSLAELIRGNVGINEMSGPVGIVNEMGAMAKTEFPFLSLLSFIALIAVNLGVMNLLPLPALDGGRIVFILIELIRGKPVKAEHEGMVHFIGIILLFALMIVVTFSDILKLGG